MAARSWGGCTFICPSPQHFWKVSIYKHFLSRINQNQLNLLKHTVLNNYRKTSLSGKSFQQQRETLKKTITERSREHQGKRSTMKHAHSFHPDLYYKDYVVSNWCEMIKRTIFLDSFLQGSFGMQRKTRNKGRRPRLTWAKIPVRLPCLFRRMVTNSFHKKLPTKLQLSLLIKPPVERLLLLLCWPASTHSQY